MPDTFPVSCTFPSFSWPVIANCRWFRADSNINRRKTHPVAPTVSIFSFRFWPKTGAHFVIGRHRFVINGHRGKRSHTLAGMSIYSETAANGSWIEKFPRTVKSVCL